MKPLLVLLTSFMLTALTFKYLRNDFRLAFSGRIAMALMLLFTASGHFVFVDGMASMLPFSIPYRHEIVYLTGILEIAAALALLFIKQKTYIAWGLLLFFAAVLPANIYAAVHSVNYQTGLQDGEGPMYLFFRVPLQLFFMAWVYCSCLIGTSPWVNSKTGE